jgi:hypothetical protein
MDQILEALGCLGLTFLVLTLISIYCFIISEIFTYLENKDRKIK